MIKVTFLNFPLVDLSLHEILVYNDGQEKKGERDLPKAKDLYTSPKRQA